ncbi:MAG: hypothetical protein FJX66_11620 [Alphaproteobacteria bacterium]|nr:hypothetical protein [Alphaproteobacteria bacterium]
MLALMPLLTRAIVATAIAIAALTTSSRAADLFVPTDRLGALVEAIDQACPECRTQGLSPCGTADIQVGKRFAKTLFQGKPPRGYLLSFLMAHGAFFDALRTPDRDEFLQSLAERFASARLISLDEGFKSARVLAPPSNVDVQYSPEHHRCFGVDRKSTSCCLGDGGDDRSCPPKADSPRVFLTFDDPEAGETLNVTWAPIAGASKLKRAPTAGGRGTLYYCLTNDAGALKGR